MGMTRTSPGRRDQARLVEFGFAMVCGVDILHGLVRLCLAKIGWKIPK